MIIRVSQDRSVLKVDDVYGTQNENRITNITFEFPEQYANFNKKIVFITSDGNYWDMITDDTYIIKNNVTKYRNVSAFIWLTDVQNNIDFRTKMFYIDFNKNENPDNYVPSEEQISGFDTMMAELREAIEEVEQLPGLMYAIVQALPTQDIDEKTIYFVPKTTPETNNAYDKYIYINNAWEIFGGSSSSTAVSNLEEVIGIDTDTFSSSSTYEIGDRVIYSKKWYECTTAVTVAGDWNSANWTEVVVIDEIDDIKDSIGDVESILYRLNRGGGV